MIRLLLDPRVLVPPGRMGASVSAAGEFWQRLVDWAGDNRVSLGEESHILICDAYGRFGYPDQDLALELPSLKREYQAALNRLLSRAIRSTSSSDERSFSPEYLGSDDESLALQLDISGTVGLGVIGIGTAADHWADSSGSVSILPPPPSSLVLCRDPGAELPIERAEAVQAYFDGKRIHVVGGQPDPFVSDAIVDCTGIPADELVWIPCERAKPPRKLDQRWSGLSPDRDVTICITGRVGHPTSQKAKIAANKKDVVHLQVETANEIVEALVVLSSSATQP